MSDRLAVSASLSVLMMAAYVLFGADAQRVPLDRDSLAPDSRTFAPAPAALARKLTALR